MVVIHAFSRDSIISLIRKFYNPAFHKRQECIHMNMKAIIGAIVAFVVYLVFAIIYFIVLGFIINFATDLVADGSVGASSLAIATAILTAGTIIAGGGFGKIFDE